MGCGMSTGGGSHHRRRRGSSDSDEMPGWHQPLPHSSHERSGHRRHQAGDPSYHSRPALSSDRNYVYGYASTAGRHGRGY